MNRKQKLIQWKRFKVDEMKKMETGCSHSDERDNSLAKFLSKMVQVPSAGVIPDSDAVTKSVPKTSIGVRFRFLSTAKDSSAEVFKSPRGSMNHHHRRSYAVVLG